jgi:hypothetical protein
MDALRVFVAASIEHETQQGGEEAAEANMLVRLIHLQFSFAKIF